MTAPIELNEAWTWHCKCGRTITTTLTSDETLVRCSVCGESYDPRHLPSDAQKVTVPVPENARKRPTLFPILAGIMFLFGILGLLDTGILLVRNMFTLQGLANCVFAMGSVAAGYGLLKLKRWTLPIFVALNVAGVLEHFILNIPFTLGNIVPWLILFYLVKHHALFGEKPITT